MNPNMLNYPFLDIANIYHHMHDLVEVRSSKSGNISAGICMDFTEHSGKVVIKLCPKQFRNKSIQHFCEFEGKYWYLNNL